jgi:uncharacterized membrane protein YvbJ
MWGESITMKYCSSCGHKTINGGQFCIECGKKLSESSHSEDGNNMSERKAFNFDLRTLWQNRDSFRYLSSKKFLIGAVSLLVIVVLFMTVGGKESPTNVAQEFINHSKNSEWKKAEELWSESGKEYLVAQLFNDERMIYQTMRNLTHHTDGDLDEYEITSEEVNGDEAVVYAKFIFDNGNREKAMFAMVKENDKWKVFAFQSGK